MAAIYQQARPFTFDQVVGQEHVKDVLTAALKRGRVGHAYLFSGPRGVGKTTTARLIAMAVNCQGAQPEKRPCGECESCLLVRRGNHPDVIELDAASNNSVEDIRDLREKVRLASIRGGSRVWVLDEAHMLSKSAANALLKTLEEPPPGLVFVLATTEPEKLPPTILSRCQHFRFRRLSESEIASKLARLCREANIEAVSEAVRLVARAADGAMRDAESLLERLLASGRAITLQDAEGALGLPPQERMRSLARHLAAGNLSALLEEAGGLYADGFAPRSLCEHLKVTVRDALYGVVGLSGADFRLELPEGDLLRVIHALDDEDERFTRRDDLFSLEVALIKALNALRFNAPSDAVASNAGEAHAAATTPATTTAAPASPPRRAPEQPARGSDLPDFEPSGRAAPPPRPRPQSRPAAPVQAEAGNPPPEEPARPPAPKINWHNVLSRAGAQLKAFMMPAQAEIDGTDIFLHFPEKNKFHYEQLKLRHAELASLVTDLFGDGIAVHLLGPGEVARKKG
jgi:DNA polymerase-3 subunit gamma/tau